MTASVADLADIMLQNKTGSSTPTIPDEYVSVGVGTGDELVAGDDYTFEYTRNGLSRMNGCSMRKNYYSLLVGKNANVKSTSYNSGWS